MRKLDHAADLEIHREVGDPTMGIVATRGVRTEWCSGWDSPRSSKTRLGLGRDDVEPLVMGAAEF